jgi:hypothetical protein
MPERPDPAARRARIKSSESGPRLPSRRVDHDRGRPNEADELKNETPAGERLSRECVPQVVWTSHQDPGRAECGILLAASRKLSRPTSPRMVVKVKRDDFSVESDPGVAVFLREARATIARSGVSIVRVTGARVLGFASFRMHRSPKVSPMQLTARSSLTRVAMSQEGGT